MKIENKTYSIKQEDSAIYLGTEISSNGKISEEIKRRLLMGSKCVGVYKKLLSSKVLSRPIKVRLYKTIIRPIVTYASECWVMTRQEESKVEAWERKVLRYIYGGINEGGIWRRRTNKEVEDLYKDTSIAKIIKQNRIRWIGHLHRLESERTVKKVYKSEPEGRNKRGRPRLSWKKEVEQDLKKLQIKEWQTITLDKKAWKEIVEKAKGL